MTRLLRPLLAILLLSLSAAWLVPSGAARTASADEDTAATVTWGVRPATIERYGENRPNFVHDVDPGDVLRDAMIVTNHGTDALTLAVYAADGFTTSAGTLDLVPAGQESIDLGAWVSTVPEVTVPAGERVRVPFTIRVPEDATPGDHSGGIVTSLATERTQGLSVDRRLGSRMHVRVSGDLMPSLKVEDLRVEYDGTANPIGRGEATVAFRLVNDGNVRVSGTQEVRVAGPFGSGVRSRRVDVPEMLPGTQLDFEVVLDRVLPMLRLGAEVTVSPQVERTEAEAEPIVAEAGAWAVPWSGLLGLAVLAALAWLARWRSRRIRIATERRVEAAVEAALIGR